MSDTREGGCLLRLSHVIVFLLIFLLFLFSPIGAQTTEVSQDAEEEDLFALRSELDALIGGLEAQLASAPDANAMKLALAAKLVKSAQKIASLSYDLDWNLPLRAQVCGAFRKALQLVPGDQEAWLNYLNFLLSKTDLAPLAAFEAPRAIQEVSSKLPKPLNASWKTLMEILEKLFADLDMPLFRMQCLEILVEPKNTAYASASKQLLILQEAVKRRSPELLSRADAAISIGDIEWASVFVNSLEKFDSKLPGLADMQQKILAARQIEKIKIELYKALYDGKAVLAENLCDRILKIDCNDPEIRNLKAELASKSMGISCFTIADEASRHTNIALQFILQLEIAAACDDLVGMRDILRKFMLLGMAAPSHYIRIQQVEQEMLESKPLISQRFLEAKNLFVSSQWQNLRRLLNRNPFMGDTVGRLIQVWEMGLAADCELEWKSVETLLAEADRLAEKAPKSFWPPYVKLYAALKRGNYDEAEKFLADAQTLDPNNRLLKKPARILLFWRHRRLLITIVIFTLLYILLLNKENITALINKIFERILAIAANILPGTVLQYVEQRLSDETDDFEKQKLYKLALRCAFAAKQPSKGIEYAEHILKKHPDDKESIEALGQYYLSLPNHTPSQFTFIIAYVKQRLDDKHLIEKVGKSFLSGKPLTPDVAQILLRYISFFPDDSKMMGKLLELYSAADSTLLTSEVIDFLEHEWKRTGSFEIWRLLLRTLLLRGLYEHFEQLINETISSGNPGEWMHIFEAADRQIEDETARLTAALGNQEKDRLIETMNKILALRFIRKQHYQPLADALDVHVTSKDVTVRYHAQKARNHLRTQVMNTEAFLIVLSRLATSASPAGNTEHADAQVGQPAVSEESIAQNDQLQQNQPCDTMNDSDVSSGSSSENASDILFEQPVEPHDDSQSPDNSSMQTAQKPTEPQFTDVRDHSQETSETFESRHDDRTSDSAGNADDIAESLQTSDEVHEDKQPIEVVPEDAASQRTESIASRILSLPNDAYIGDVQQLVQELGAEALPYWLEYIKRPLSLTLLENLPRLLAAFHSNYSTPIFAELLKSEYPRVRANAVEALEENADPKAVPILISLLRDEDNRVRANAVKALASFGVELVLDELRGMIEDPRVEIRDSATYVLKGIRGEESAVLLERLLRDGSPLVRFNAIKSLVIQGDSKNLQRLMEYLPEVADPEERDFLLKAIAQLQKAS